MTGKTQRQLMITDWLRDHRVGSQEEIVARLSLAGIAATQATVSRDLLEIGAVKVKREGSIRYILPDQLDSGHAAAKLDRLLAEWVDAIIPAGNLLVLKTPPGSANLVANALDAAGLPEVAGTIAGDDTIFVALAEGVDPGVAARQLQQRRSGA
jgi:transcriptional regulator of arginine metabolism